MTQPVIFVSYSRKDESEKNKLLSHLGVLQREGLTDLWSDDRIGAGADWRKDISQAMAQARVAILFITANFLTSDFILGKEVPTLLQRRKSEGLIVFPVIARSCAWQQVDWLTQMNVRPKNGRPVWGWGRDRVDKELAIIAEEVAVIVRTGSPIISTARDVSEKSERTSMNTSAETKDIEAEIKQVEKRDNLTTSNSYKPQSSTQTLQTPQLTGIEQQEEIIAVAALKKLEIQPVEIPVIRFASGTEITSVSEWVKQTEQNWTEAVEFLYDGTIENWLTYIGQSKLATEASNIIKQFVQDQNIGLEQFQRIAGPFKVQRKTDVVTNLDSLIGDLNYWKLHKQKDPKHLTLLITNKGRGYMHGKVISKVNWVEVPKPNFGCLYNQTARIDIVADPTKRKVWYFSLVPVDFVLE